MDKELAKQILAIGLKEVVMRKEIIDDNKKIIKEARECKSAYRMKMLKHRGFVYHCSQNQGNHCEFCRNQ